MCWVQLGPASGHWDWSQIFLAKLGMKRKKSPCGYRGDKAINMHVKWISNWAPLVDDGICLELVCHWAKLVMTKIPVSAMNIIRHEHKAVTLMDICTKTKPILTCYLMDMDVDLMVPVPIGIATCINYLNILVECDELWFG